jgi:phosphoribosylglycinamide formyltransferase-1
VPAVIIENYPNRILNIHPALLPRYGGKGMYGMNVHEAVKKSGDTETGLTIHFVNEKYDDGQIVYQHRVPVSAKDSAEDIAEKVLVNEHKYYPLMLEQCIRNDIQNH